MSRIRLPSVSSLAAALLALGLAACASLPAPGPAGVAAAGPAAPASAAAGGTPPPGHVATAPAPGTPPPFATVIKDAKKIDGLLTLWQKDDKVWIELKPEDFGQPMLLSPKLASGIGEAGLFGGSMRLPGAATEEQLVEFRRIHNQVQLIARNAEFVAPAESPEGRAVAAAFSPSLLGSAFVASQPEPERKSVLIEANGLFLSDMLGLAQSLQRSYRQGYNLDARNSAILRVRGKPDEVVFETQNHYWTSSISVPQGSSATAPSWPHTLPDARSLFLRLHYSLAKLPDAPMRPRLADARVGYFSTLTQNFADDLARTPKQRYINRWRLEKKDPQAALSEPVKPITYWLDRTIPLKYRAAITAGVLEWNKAFEKIGFKDAIVVKVQPDDADFDTLDADVASIRWMTNASPASGPSGRAMWTRAAARSSMPTSASRACPRGTCAACGRRCSTRRPCSSRCRTCPMRASRAPRRWSTTARNAAMRRRPRISSTTRSTCSRRAARSIPTAPRPSSSCSTT